MILTGQRVTPEKLLRAGFSFDFPELRRALAAAVARQPVRETNPLP
jgi:NAD dependent epimerase/dehydratase family enzyme